MRRNNSQRLHVGPKQLDLRLGQIAPIYSRRTRPFQQGIIDIRHVLGIVHVKARVDPDALQGVKSEIGVGMANMGRIVGSDATHIKAGHIQRLGQHEAVSFGVMQPGCT